MKVNVQPAAQEFTLNKRQLARLQEIATRKNYYWTQGRSGELLDELANMGLVYGGCGGGSDEQYRVTEKGRLVYEKVFGQ